MDECPGDGVPGLCPASQVSLDWNSFWYVNLWLPILVQLLLSLFFVLIMHPAYVEAYYRRTSFQRFVKTYFGTSDSPKVARPLCLVTLYTLQTLASAAAVAVWVWHTYSQQMTPTSSKLLLALTKVELLGWAANRLRGGCELRSLWESSALVDLVTSVPVLMGAYAPWLLPVNFDSWMTLHFLLSYNALVSFERARRVSQLDEHTAYMAQGLTQLVLRISALLTLMAGTIFLFEVLGDPPGVSDYYLETDGGDRVSFFQMVYWIVVTITTVGYGDFAPRTLIARTLTTGFIVIGVATIYYIQISFSEMQKQQQEGTGKYWQRSWGRERHVVVVLCHHGSASRMASLIHGFLQELLHASHNQLEDHHDRSSTAWSHFRLWLRGAPPQHVQTWPDVVFLSPTRWEEGRRGSSFNDFLKAADFPANMQRRIWFLVGNATSETDLERARVRDSALTFVLSDLNSLTPDEDDGQTVYSALCIRDIFPEVRLRLMVLKPESKEIAVQAGIEATRVFSAHELSASLLAQNVRCRGLIPAVTAMLKSQDEDDQEFFLRKQAAQATKDFRRLPSMAGSVALQGSVSVTPEESAQRQSTMTRPSLGIPGFNVVNSGSSSVQHCRTLDEIEKVLRKSQTQWDPEKQAYELRDPWMFEYLEGAEKTIFGFDLNADFDGLSWGELVKAIYKQSGALLLAVQHRGSLVLCPQGRKWKARAMQVCFAVAPSADALDPCRFDPEDRTSWRNLFQESRRKRRRMRAHGQSRKMCAAQLMGWRVEKALLLEGPQLLPELRNRSGTEEKLLHETRPKLETLREDRSSGEESPARSRTWTPTTCVRLRSQKSFERLSMPLELSVRALRQQSLERGEELVVLIVCHGETWQQVRTFVTNMRQAHLPLLQPIVILAPTSPPVGLAQDFAACRVLCLKGSCLDAQALIEAGVLEASAVVAMAGEPARQGCCDFRMVLVSQELECWLGSSQKEVFTAFELLDSRSVRHLPRVSLGRHLNYEAGVDSMSLLRSCALRKSSHDSAMNKAEWMGPQASMVSEEDLDSPTSPGVNSSELWEDISEESELEERLGSGIEDTGHTRRPLKTWLKRFLGPVAELQRSHDSIMFHPRFAAGQVFSPELWGMMLGRMFYMPAVIELIEALVMGAMRGQQAYPWQMRVPPKYISRPFRELLGDLALGSVLCESSKGPPSVPLALYRLNEDFSCDAAFFMERACSNGSLAGDDIPNTMDVEGIGGHHYLIMCPPPDMTLRRGDWVLVLGGAVFGRKMQERGLLRGCRSGDCCTSRLEKACSGELHSPEASASPKTAL